MKEATEREIEADSGLKEQLLETMRAKTGRRQEIARLIRTLDAVIGDSQLLKRQLEEEAREVEKAELHALQTLESLNARSSLGGNK